MATFAQKTFSASSYATFRPSYPPKLYNTILSHHHGPRTTLLDLGCGPGLVSRALAPHFTTVWGTDPSAGMIAQASAHASNAPNIRWKQGSAEDLSWVEDGSVDMIVAGQAAHWFDFSRVWAEVYGKLRRGGTVAFWGYKDNLLVDFPRASAVADRFCYGGRGGIWGVLGTAWTGEVEGTYNYIQLQLQLHLLFFRHTFSQSLRSISSSSHIISTESSLLSHTYSCNERILHQPPILITMASTNYREAFQLFDKRGTQRVQLDQLGDLLRACGQNPTLSEIRELEKNVGGEFDFETFSKILNRPGGFRDPGEPEEYCRGFQVFDKNLTGYIGVGQLRYILTNLGEKMSDEEVDELLKAVDTSSGEINYTDLVRTILAN
ncbi:hypothetical protein EYC80_008220 [Monilinia laxa]|uniref:EF-hand domain-containing protein n=1 Tax=Monilinia laxa TaxID=61186 RepID=A0A5N6JVR1_MONLA|nr:hypothetical protein EYC80_008220 [Monilinia laxa]